MISIKTSTGAILTPMSDDIAEEMLDKMSEVENVTEKTEEPAQKRKAPKRD